MKALRSVTLYCFWNHEWKLARFFFLLYKILLILSNISTLKKTKYAYCTFPFKKHLFMSHGTFPVYIFFIHRMLESKIKWRQSLYYAYSAHYGKPNNSLLPDIKATMSLQSTPLTSIPNLFQEKRNISRKRPYFPPRSELLSFIPIFIFTKTN